jgi:hypothetical protein
VKLCHELERLGERPRLAGWDNFVTVCFDNNTALSSRSIDIGDKQTGQRFSLGQKKIIQYVGPNTNKPNASPIAIVTDGWSDKQYVNIQ